MINEQDQKSYWKRYWTKIRKKLDKTLNLNTLFTALIEKNTCGFFLKKKKLTNLNCKK
jgi:hypothetical protein